MESDYRNNPDFETTIENIDKLQKDCKLNWDEWNVKNDNILDLTIDFRFYSADKEKTSFFKSHLTEKKYNVSIVEKRTMIFFKGYELKASLKKKWEFETFKNHIWEIGILGRKFSNLIEGYGAFKPE